MRIRRRPQPSSLQAAGSSDLAGAASTAPQTPLKAAARNRGGWLLAAGGEDEDREAKLLHASSADLVLGQKSGVARRLALPQDDNVVVDCGGRSMGGGAQRGADDDDGRMRFSMANGHGGSEHKDGSGAACTGGVGGRYEPPVAVKATEERVTSNGFVQQPAAASAPPVAAAAVVKDEGKKQKQATSNGTGTGAGAKKRRGPAVLLEGSRCSRVNGRGWRCSQPTLVGYSLCEHHLGKGRMRSAAAAAAARGGGNAGVGRLGRTEHGARIAATVVAVGAARDVVATAAAPPPKAEGPSLPGC